MSAEHARSLRIWQLPSKNEDDTGKRQRLIFNSYIFLFAFLPITYIVFWSLRSASHRYIWLTITGYFFYGWWDPRFCLLMLFSTLVSYFAGLGFRNTQDLQKRRLLLVLPISVDLLVLGIFKYLGFGLESLAAALSMLGVEVDFSWGQLTLPVGISFYTFHTISYIVDCYRKDVQPTRNFFEFAAYVSLFSQLVAGPIVRFRQLEEDLEGLGKASRVRWLAQGLSLFLTGLVEKTVIADTLATFTNASLLEYERLSTIGMWLSMLGYTFQLYFDFSGYSTMAVGLGLLFGLRIPQNFNSPYQALNPSDFWQRWHISLSSCMRDYVYIPLGSGRCAPIMVYRNLMLTMLIGGLWHGANWTFILWGAWHGFCLCFYRLTSHVWDRQPIPIQKFLLLLMVIIGWVLFRSPNLATATAIYSKMFFPVVGLMPEHAFKFVTFLVIAGLWSMVGKNPIEMHDRDRGWNYSIYTGAFVFGVALAYVSSWQNSPFLYFQF